MRKKVISFVLALVMGASLFTGCGNPVSVKENETTVQEQSTFGEETEAKTEEEPEADTNEGEGTGDTEAVEVDTETAAGGEETPDEGKSAGTPDITPTEAALEKPAQIGEWVEAKKRSVQDKNYHTVYFRLTGVIAGEEAKKIVDEYNAAGNVVKVSDLEKEDLEYRVVTYEVYFPEDFPQADYGISDVGLNLNLCNLKDSGAIAGYIGLSTVWDISDKPDTFHAGETFKEGRAVFAMVKGSSEYLFKYGYKDENGTQANVYVAGQ